MQITANFTDLNRGELKLMTIIKILQEYRDDNRDPLKIYTNPDYFFELWRENLQKEMEKARQLRKERKRLALQRNKARRDSN